MTERIDSKSSREEQAGNQIDRLWEALAHSPRWKSADFSFRLSGVIDLRSASGNAAGTSLPASNTEHPATNPKDQKK